LLDAQKKKGYVASDLQLTYTFFFRKTTFFFRSGHSQFLSIYLQESSGGPQKKKNLFSIFLKELCLCHLDNNFLNLNYITISFHFSLFLKNSALFFRMKLWTCMLLFGAVVTTKAYTGDNMDGMLFMRTSEREQQGCSRVGMSLIL